MKNVKLFKVLVSVAAMASSTWATEAILAHKRTLRRDPSAANPPIARAQEAEDVELIKTRRHAGTTMCGLRMEVDALDLGGNPTNCNSAGIR